MGYENRVPRMITARDTRLSRMELTEGEVAGKYDDLFGWLEQDARSSTGEPHPLTVLIYGPFNDFARNMATRALRVNSASTILLVDSFAGKIPTPRYGRKDGRSDNGKGIFFYNALTGGIDAARRLNLDYAGDAQIYGRSDADLAVVTFPYTDILDCLSKMRRRGTHNHYTLIEGVLSQSDEDLVRASARATQPTTPVLTAHRGQFKVVFRGVLTLSHIKLKIDGYR